MHDLTMHLLQATSTIVSGQECCSYNNTSYIIAGASQGNKRGEDTCCQGNKLVCTWTISLITPHETDQGTSTK